MEGYVTPEEASGILRISRGTITRCKQMGAPVRYIGTCGRRYLINPDDFAAWMDAQGQKDAGERLRKLSLVELRARRHASCG